MNNESHKRRTAAGDGRGRVLETAYELFQHHGLHGVGVDRIIAEASVAKTTLYRHFPSKDDLAIAVLEHHREVWTRGWLQAEIEKRSPTPAGQILALFDAYDSWFRSGDYHGCLLANSLLESRDPANAVHSASREALNEIRALIRERAQAAGARDPDWLAFAIQIMLLGSVVAAVNGFADGAVQMRPVARLLLEQDGIHT
jgi:AcrR family transcriptional regulator